MELKWIFSQSTFSVNTFSLSHTIVYVSERWFVYFISFCNAFIKQIPNTKRYSYNGGIKVSRDYQNTLFSIRHYLSVKFLLFALFMENIRTRISLNSFVVL